ncbi:cation diffusion facilitator family transporter [Tepidamorphus sp. 3E244]|uniref:cation diffusion facilitator family transporter n=1 Tax=Tepidamorphus sp. 3E244 TaxID=3385498 RepID=UPI0038FC7220
MTQRIYPQLPEDKREEMRRAVRLEWWTLFWLATIVALMYFVMGSSQAMKSAWIEDLLSFLPPILFILTTKIENRPPSRKYPYGFHRFGSLAFFAAACALLAMGAFLLYEAVKTLITQEHPTIGTVEIFGENIWLGWLMMGALAYSCIPPVILGRMKKKPAHQLADKILITDADMNAADWQTGAAGILGIAGIALGWWWADAAAAGLISFSILWDGLTNCRIAFAELMDGAPRKLTSADIHPAVPAISENLKARYPGSEIRARETGRYIRAVVTGNLLDELPMKEREALASKDDAWRLVEVSRTLAERPTDE